MQTFNEAISGNDVNPTYVTRADYEKMLRTTTPEAPKTMAAKLPLRNATMAQMGGTSNRVQQIAKQQEAKQKQMQRQANPPKVATNQISKEDLNKVSSGVQRKIKASQRANKQMQMIPANAKPIKTTTTSQSVSKFQDMITAPKKSMKGMVPTKTKGKK